MVTFKLVNVFTLSGPSQSHASLGLQLCGSCVCEVEVCAGVGLLQCVVWIRCVLYIHYRDSL